MSASSSGNRDPSSLAVKVSIDSVDDPELLKWRARMNWNEILHHHERNLYEEELERQQYEYSEPMQQPQQRDHDQPHQPIAVAGRRGRAAHMTRHNVVSRPNASAYSRVHTTSLAFDASGEWLDGELQREQHVNSVFSLLLQAELDKQAAAAAAAQQQALLRATMPPPSFTLSNPSRSAALSFPPIHSPPSPTAAASMLHANMQYFPRPPPVEPTHDIPLSPFHINEWQQQMEARTQQLPGADPTHPLPPNSNAITVPNRRSNPAPAHLLFYPQQQVGIDMSPFLVAAHPPVTPPTMPSVAPSKPISQRIQQAQQMDESRKIEQLELLLHDSPLSALLIPPKPITIANNQPKPSSDGTTVTPVPMQSLFLRGNPASIMPHAPPSRPNAPPPAGFVFPSATSSSSSATAVAAPNTVNFASTKERQRVQLAFAPGSAAAQCNLNAPTTRRIQQFQESKEQIEAKSEQETVKREEFIFQSLFHAPIAPPVRIVPTVRIIPPVAPVAVKEISPAKSVEDDKAKAAREAEVKAIIAAVVDDVVRKAEATALANSSAAPASVSIDPTQPVSLSRPVRPRVTLLPSVYASSAVWRSRPQIQFKIHSKASTLAAQVAPIPPGEASPEDQSNQNPVVTAEEEKSESIEGSAASASQTNSTAPSVENETSLLLQANDDPQQIVSAILSEMIEEAVRTIDQPSMPGVASVEASAVATNAEEAVVVNAARASPTAASSGGDEIFSAVSTTNSTEPANESGVEGAPNGVIVIANEVYTQVSVSRTAEVGPSETHEEVSTTPNEETEATMNIKAVSVLDNTEVHSIPEGDESEEESEVVPAETSGDTEPSKSPLQVDSTKAFDSSSTPIASPR